MLAGPLGLLFWQPAAEGSCSWACSRYPRKPHGDPSAADPCSRVGKLRRTIPPRPAQRETVKTRLDVGEVERTVVVGVIAVRKTLRGRNGARSDTQESQDSEHEMLWHMTYCVHDDTPLTIAKVRIIL